MHPIPNAIRIDREDGTSVAVAPIGAWEQGRHTIAAAEDSLGLLWAVEILADGGAEAKAGPVSFSGGMDLACHIAAGHTLHVPLGAALHAVSLAAIKAGLDLAGKED